jgi:trans-aconitate methyltransferase
MRLDDAIGLIRSAVEGHDGVWADLGAGGGIFTRALVHLLGPDSRIYAVDRDEHSVAELEALPELAETKVTVIRADFTGEIELPQLDGVLLANALHFVENAGAVLNKLTKKLRPGGRVVLVEYDRRSASRWVPHPIAIADLPALAAKAGVAKFTVVESRPSNYEGIIYVAVAETPGLAGP